MASKVLYLIGSLRNSRVPELAKTIRSNNPDIEVFDDWYAAGPEADDHWKAYEQARGSSYQEALKGHAARNVFAFDRRHLDRATHALLVLPAGKSGHMEVMYATYGVKAKTAILLDPEDVRWDVMYQFVGTVLNNDGEIDEWLDQTSSENPSKTVTPPGFMTTSPISKLSSQRIGGSITQEKQCQPLPQNSQVKSTTRINPASNLSPVGHLKDLRKSLASGRRNTRRTTGVEGFNIAGWSEPPSVTSTPSTTAKT